MLSLVVFVGALGAGVLSLALLWPLLKRPALSRRNYRGRTLPTAAGLVFAPAFLITYLVVLIFDRHSLPHVGARESMLVVVLGLCLLGLLDDMLGDREFRGFRGHLVAAAHGKFTTGFIKAMGGVLVGMAAAALFTHSIGQIVLDGVLIALAANLANLLDVRPGRALKVFCVALVAVVALNWGDRTVMPWLLAVGAIALVLAPGDLRELFMLGDAGSNVLGGCIGVGIVVGAGFWWRLGIAIALLALNLLSEKLSFSSAIEHNRALSWLDMLGRKGESEPGANYNNGRPGEPEV